MARLQLSHERWRYWRVGPHKGITYRFCYTIEPEHGVFHAWTQEVRRTGGGWDKRDMQIREYADEIVDLGGTGRSMAMGDARKRKNDKQEEMLISGEHYEVLVKRLSDTRRLPENLPSIVRYVRARVAQRDFILKSQNGYGYRLYLRHKSDAETLAFEFQMFGCGDTYRDTPKAKGVRVWQHSFNLEHRPGWKDQ